MIKEIIVYKKIKQNYEVIKCKDLKEGHEIYNNLKDSNNFDYIELGIDKGNKYLIVRKHYKK